MPELGGNRFANNFTGVMDDMRKRVDAAIAGAQTRIARAADGLADEISAGAGRVERAIVAEQGAVRRSYAEMLGNDPEAAGAGAGNGAEPPARPTAQENGSQTGSG